MMRRYRHHNTLQTGTGFRNLEIFGTVVSGVIIFSIGQIFLKLILKPAQDLDKLRGEIAY